MKQVFLLLVATIYLAVGVSAQEYGFDIWTTADGENEYLFKNPPDAPVFERFTDEAGLPLAGVTCLFQDSKGFLWVGSYLGLHRFDGYRFVIYKKDLQDKNGVSVNNINSIYETRAGQMWIGTFDGLNFYDRANDNFKVLEFN